MPTTVTSSIGTSSRDYSTLQTWEDAAPANLVTSDQIWRGEVYNDSAFTSAANLLTISGSTSSATCYKELIAAAGESFIDQAGVQSNPLFFDASKGVSITLTGSYVTPGAIDISEAYARVSRLQIRGTGGGNGAAKALTGAQPTMLVDNCIFSSFSVGFSAGTLFIGGGTFRNCLVVCNAASAYCIVQNSSSGAAAFYNCTFASISSVAAATNAYGGSYNTHIHKNCAYFNCTKPLKTGSGAGTPTSTTCYTDGTATTGFTNIAFASAGFVNTASDFRLGASAALSDVGTTDATNAAFDIVGTARPQGTAYDVGCWEYVSAGGGSFKAGKPLVIGQAIGGMY